MADIVLYDRTGSAVTYSGVDTITTDTPTDGETATFTYGKVVEGTEIDLALADGDQTVSVPAGSLLREATIKKPETMTPEHIKKGVDVAGVIGTFAGDEMEKTVDLNMADGDQIVDADPDTVMTKVTVRKPETLVPGNIADGVEIGGVVGTLIDTGAVIVDGTGSNVENGATAVRTYAFYRHSGIVNVAFPKCSQISSYAFYACSNLEYASMPECTKISDYAFYGCSKIISVYLPECTRIPSSAFGQCPKLQTIVLGQNETTDDVFSPTGATQVYGSAFFNCKSLTAILDKTGEYVLIKLATSGGTFAFAACDHLQEIGLYFNQYYGIPSNTFDGCYSLSCLHIGSIVDGNFVSSDYLTVGCTSNYGIGYNAFASCSALEKIKLKISGILNVKDMAFSGCAKLSQIFFDTRDISSSASMYSTTSRLFDKTPIMSSGLLGDFGSIYVPTSQIDWYKNKAGWSVFSSRYVPYDFETESIVEE